MKNAFWKMAIVAGCSVWGGTVIAMGPGGCQSGPGTGGHQPMQTLMSLESSLDLQPEQRKAWDEFTAVIDKRRGEMMGTMMAQRAAVSGGTAPEHLRGNASLFEKRAGMMRSMADALEPLYAKLTPEQRAIVDQTIVGHEQP